MADDWRAGYAPAMDRVRRGELPWTRIDDLHRMILDELLAAAGITSIADEDVDHLNRAWHRLDPWPDSVAGLTRLKERFVITTLSNGNVSLLTNMAKRAGLPWDCVISAELFHHYKPDPEAYLGCADLLGVRAGGADARRRPSRRSACRARRGPDDRVRRAAAGVRAQSATLTGSTTANSISRQRIFSTSPTNWVPEACGVAWRSDRSSDHRTAARAEQGIGSSRRSARRTRTSARATSTCSTDAPVTDATPPKNTGAIQAAWASGLGSMLYDNAQAFARKTWSARGSCRSTGWTSRPAASPSMSAAARAT